MTHPYLGLSDEELMRQCAVETVRGSGPGGQHRNKTEGGVRLTHRPTGVVAQGFERRSQHENKTVALGRLRESIALEVRRPVDLEGFAVGPELRGILPGAKQRVGP